MRGRHMWMVPFWMQGHWPVLLFSFYIDNFEGARYLTTHLLLTGGNCETRVERTTAKKVEQGLDLIEPAADMGFGEKVFWEK